MPTLPSSREELQQICDLVHTQAIEPARTQAKEIVQEAERKAAGLLQEAKKQAEEILSQARAQIVREEKSAQAALHRAGREAVGSLRYAIETELLSKEISSLTEKTMAPASVLLEFLKKYLEWLERNGWDKDFTVEVSSMPEAKDLAKFLSASCAQQLKGGCVLPVLHEGGLRIKLHDRHLTIDASESAICELLGTFLRKEIRAHLFG